MQVRAPQVRPDDLVAGGTGLLRSEASLEQVLLEDVQITALTAPNLRADEAVLRRVALSEAKLEKLSLSDVLLEACHLPAAACADGSWMRVRAAGCRLSGIDLSRVTLKDVVFRDCKLDMANFRFAKVERVMFVNCQLVETDFQGAMLHNVAFEGCRIERAEFANCSVKSVDVRTSELTDIRGWESLKGLKIDSVQLTAIAPQLALALGLKVGD